MFKYFIYAFLLFTSISFSQSKWEWINPYPHGANFVKIQFIAPSIAYAVGGTALLKTTDNGESWEEYLVGNGYGIIRDMHFINENVGYSITSDQGEETSFNKTTNGGLNWQSTLINDESMNIHFVNEKVGYINVHYFVMKTTNGGINWNTILTNNNLFYNDILVLDENNVTVIATNGKVFTTTTGGSRWTETKISENKELIDIAKINENASIILTKDGSVIKTTDNGLTWNSTIVDTIKNFISITFINDSCGFITGQNGLLYKSSDQGNSWKKLPVLTKYNLNSISFSDEFNGLACGDLGTFLKTTDGGETWFLISRYSEMYVRKIEFLNKDTAYAIAGTEIKRTTNGGLSWEPQESNLNLKLLDISFADKYKGIIAADSGIILYTQDGGAKWNISSTKVLPVSFVKYIKNTNIAFLTGNSGTYKSTDGGSTWQIRNKLSSGVLFLDENLGFYVSDYYLAKTTDGGYTFSKQETYVDNDIFTFVDSNFGMMTGHVGGCGTYVHVTTNGGISFNTYFASFQDPKGLKIKDKNFSVLTVYYRDRDSGIRSEILISNDGGKTWQPDYVGQLPLFNIGIINDYTFVYSYHGFIIRRENALPLDVQVPLDSSPKNYELSQCFPNPFNPTTTINYSIVRQGTASLIVYDVLGNKIKEIFNEEKFPGNYSVEFTGNGLPSGIYFYQLKAGAFTSTRKMILLK